MEGIRKLYMVKFIG